MSDWTEAELAAAWAAPRHRHPATFALPERQDHAEARGYPLRCVCTYQAKDRADLDEHITEAPRGE